VHVLASTETSDAAAHRYVIQLIANNKQRHQHQGQHERDQEISSASGWFDK